MVRVPIALNANLRNIVGPQRTFKRHPKQLSSKIFLDNNGSKYIYILSYIHVLFIIDNAEKC